MGDLDHKASWAQKNWCFWTVVLEKNFWESLGLQGDPTSPSWRKSVLNIHWKDWCWRWNSNTLAPWWKELTHLKRPWCWERLRAGGEGDNRGWWLCGINDSIETSLSKLWKIVKDWEAWHSALHGIVKNWTWLSDWETTKLSKQRLQWPHRVKIQTLQI